jgi:hypothetical protein
MGRTSFFSISQASSKKEQAESALNEMLRALLVQKGLLEKGDE